MWQKISISCEWNIAKCKVVGGGVSVNDNNYVFQDYIIAKAHIVWLLVKPEGVWRLSPITFCYGAA